MVCFLQSLTDSCLKIYLIFTEVIHMYLSVKFTDACRDGNLLSVLV